MKKNLLALFAAIAIIVGFVIGPSLNAFAEPVPEKKKLKIKCDPPNQTVYKWTCTGSVEACHYNYYCPK